MDDTLNEGGVECPSCGCVHTDTMNLFPGEDWPAMPARFDCDNCGAPIRAEIMMEITYASRIAEG